MIHDVTLSDESRQNPQACKYGSNQDKHSITVSLEQLKAYNETKPLIWCERRTLKIAPPTLSSATVTAIFSSWARP